MIGLYDQQGVLRFAGRDQADCLAYAELFGLGAEHFSLESLLLESEVLSAGARLAAGCSN